MFVHIWGGTPGALPVQGGTPGKPPIQGGTPEGLDLDLGASGTLTQTLNWAAPDLNLDLD